MKNLLLAMLLFSVSGVFAQKVVDYPPYDFRNTGILRVSRVELTDSTTRMYMLSEFLPNWWMSFDQNLYIRDTESGEELHPTAIEGAKWGERKFTPASGVDHFVFTFPAFRNEVKKIDWIDDGSNIWGINLEKDAKPASQLPEALTGNWLKTDGSNEWIYGLHARNVVFNNKYWQYESVKPKGKTTILNLTDGQQHIQLFATLLPDGKLRIGTEKKGGIIVSKEKTFVENQVSVDVLAETFFQPGGVARLQGSFQGYDPRAGFTTGLIYLENAIRNESTPTVVEISPEGHFDVELATDYPTMKYIVFGGLTVPIYIEPGKTLTLFIDWEDLLKADRYRDRNYTDFKEIRFMGPLGKINADIMAASVIPGFNYRKLQDMVKQLTPTEFKNQQAKEYAAKSEQFARIAAQEGFSSRTRAFLQNNLLLSYAGFLLDYASNRKYEEADANNKALNTPIEPDYYDFLQSIPMDSEWLLASDHFSSFINRFEFSSPFFAAYKTISNTPEKTFSEFVLESKVPLSRQEKEAIEYWAKIGVKGIVVTPENKAEIDRTDSIMTKFSITHADLLKVYTAKYVKPQKNYTPLVQEIIVRQAKDSILRDYFKLKPNLVYDITKIRSLGWQFKDLSRRQADTLLRAITTAIPHPYLKKIGEEVLDKTHPANGPQTYAIAEGKAGDIFRKIVEPYKGKVVFVDFWATSCGPCRAGIKSMKPLREKYRDKEVAFVFITDENSSPLEAYTNFMKDVEGEKYRIPEDDYNYLRQLFHFNGIPRYVLLDKEGRVVNDDFQRYGAEKEFQRLLEE